ncbi:hypothetical protein RQP46_005362 [Phenoliferia psychrophenolica]
MSETQTPLHIGVVLFPGFQLLDVAGPLDCFNILSQSHPLKLSILSTTLAPVTTLSLVRGASLSSFSQSIVPTHTFSSPPSTPIDVLFLPGGLGTRPPNDLEELKAFLVQHAPAARFILTVCTGSGLLAQTGLLDGKRATGNKNSWEWTTEQSGGVEWVYKARWVEDGRFWTSSGVSAGIDMALAWVAKVYGGEVAERIAKTMEYVWERDSTVDSFADLYKHDV